MSPVNHQRSIPQASEQEVTGIFETQNWTALRVTESYKTLGGRVHTAIEQDALGEKH